MTSASLPLADSASFRREALRTRGLRLGLATLLLGLGVGAVLLARGPRNPSTEFLAPSDSNTIVVLDVSGSVELQKIRLAYRALSLLGQSNKQVGLVVFSGYAYEALPPDSPAATLLPIANLFQLHRAPGGLGPSLFLAPNPWDSGFSSGTEISSGLVLARSLIEQNHLSRPTVLLISDLLDDKADYANVAEAGRTYRRLGIALHIVPLYPRPADLRFFSKVAGPSGTVVSSDLVKHTPLRTIQHFPVALVVVVLLLDLLIAANELLFTPLSWRASAAAESYS
jgi:hypothetical protein